MDEPAVKSVGPGNTLRFVSGGFIKESVDGGSGDPDSGGGPPASPVASSRGQEEQGPSPDRRDNGEGGNEAEAGGATEGDNRLPEPRAPIPFPEGEGSVSGKGEDTENPFISDPGNVLKTIADRFVRARDLQKAEAWRQFQRDLMHASPYLVPHIIPYKDLISVVADIEKEIKGSTGQTGRSNEELMADFLRGGSYVPAVAIPGPPEGVDLASLAGESLAGEVGEVDEEGLDTGPIMQVGKEGAIPSA